MKHKKFYFLLFLSFFLFLLSVKVFAQGSIDIFAQNPVSSGDIGKYINGLYNFSLLVGGILAFGAVVYGGLKYIFAAGNPSGQSEGKDWIKSALLGLLLLSGAYLILKTINPNIVGLNLPTLSGLSSPPPSPPPTTGGGGGNCAPTSGGEGVCSGTGCGVSPGEQQVIGCVENKLPGSVTYTSNGQHVCSPPSVSCHFGGSCTDGSHAFDVSRGGNSLSYLQQAKAVAEQCGASTGNSVSCRCESQNGAQLDPSCTQSFDNHLHCNVNTASCNCN